MRSHTSIPSATTVGSPQVAQGNQAPVQSSTGSLQHVAQVHQPPVQSSTPSMHHVPQGPQPPMQSSTGSMQRVAQGNQLPVLSSTHFMQHVAQGNQLPVPSSTHFMQHVAQGNQPPVPSSTHFMQHVVPSQSSRQPWHNSNPFIVVSISNRVKKCAGCPYAFRDTSGPTFIGLVVQHKERDIYFDATGIRRLSSEANRYYHCQWECLKARHPYISIPMIQIDPVLLLDDYQRHCLESLLGLSF